MVICGNTNSENRGLEEEVEWERTWAVRNQIGTRLNFQVRSDGSVITLPTLSVLRSHLYERSKAQFVASVSSIPGFNL